MEDDFNEILETRGVNCYIPSRNGCFLRGNKYIFKNVSTKEDFQFIQSCKTRTTVMTRYRLPEVGER